MSAWRCWPVVKHATRRHRRHRRIKRILAAATISKPAAIVWTCVAVGGGFWGAWPALVPPAPTPRVEVSRPAAPQPVPEPSSLLLMLAPLAGLWAAKSRGRFWRLSR